MRKIRFKINYGKHQAGHVIGTSDSSAAKLVSMGVAKYVEDSVRPFKYAAGASVQSECVAPLIEELESSPKGAIIPPQYLTPEAPAEARETKAVKKKQKQTNTINTD